MTDRVSPEEERIFAFRQLPTGPTAAGEAREWSAKVLACWDLAALTDDLQTVVTDGRVTTGPADAATALDAGDSIRFDAARPHVYEGHGPRNRALLLMLHPEP